jgi:urease accessory protein
VEGAGTDVRAAARIEVARRDGRDVLVDVRSEPPLAVRATAERVLLVGSAAGPVGGDELAVDIVVGPGATLALGTAAATLAWPGPSGRPSTQAVHADIAEGAVLRWEPEPLIAVAGCRHHSTTTVRLAAGAVVWLLEEVALGRTGEPSGCVTLTWRVERAGRVLLHHTEQLGPDVPGWGSAVSAGGHRHLLAAITVGRPAPETPPAVTADVAAAVLAVAPDAWVVLVAGSSRPVARRALATIVPG